MYRRADTSWMKGSFGLSFHWTSGSDCQDGTHLPYIEAVDRFDVMKVADMLSVVGASDNEMDDEEIEGEDQPIEEA